MKVSLLSWATPFVALAAVHVDAQNLPPAYRFDDHGRAGAQYGRYVDPTTLMRSRAGAIQTELDDIADHLIEARDDREGARLFAQVNEALQEATHFRSTVVAGIPMQRAYDQFRSLDARLLDLMQGLEATNDPALRRASERLAYADEQLHAAVAPAAGQVTPDFVARQVHVLSGEARHLEQVGRATFGRRGEGDAIMAALHEFIDAAEHFHETAENEKDLAHVIEDFAIVDRQWKEVARQMGQNPHGNYFYRRAQRVGSMLDNLREVLGDVGRGPVLFRPR